MEYNTPEYKKWRKRVFGRDRYTCKLCNAHNKPIEAHHIKMWARYPKLRYYVSNGITLCIDCHTMITGQEEWWEQRLYALLPQKRQVRLDVIRTRYGKT